MPIKVHLVSAVTGVLVDRYSKKTVMISSDFLRFLLCIGLYINELFFESFWPLIIVVFFIELLGQFYNIASASVIPALANSDQYLKANSYLTMIENVTSIIGFALGGILIGFFGLEYIIVINGLSFLLSVLFIWKIKLNHQKQEEKSINQPKKEIKTEFVEGLKIVFQNRIIRTLLIIIFVVNIGTSSLEMLITIWAHDVLIIGSSGFGILLTSILVGSLIGSGLVNLKWMKKFSSSSVISLAITVFGVILAGVTFFTSFSVNLVLFCILGIFLSIVNIHFSTIIMSNTDERNLGKVFGIVQTSVRGGHPIGIAVVTALLQFVNVNWIIFSIGLIVLVGGLYLIYIFLSGARQQETNVQSE